MKIYYGKNVYGKEEIKAVTQQLNKSTQMGLSVQKFEEKISNYFSKKYGLMVNSGSSAIMLAVKVLDLKKGVKANPKVINTISACVLMLIAIIIAFIQKY